MPARHTIPTTRPHWFANWPHGSSLAGLFLAAALMTLVAVFVSGY